MEETSKSNCDSCRDQVDCTCDNKDSDAQKSTDSNIADGQSLIAQPVNGDCSAEPTNENQSEIGNTEQSKESKPQAQGSIKNKPRGQKRRQRTNVNRIPGVPIQSLFSMPVVQDSFDLRNVLGRQVVGDQGGMAPAWWHQRPQPNNFQQPAKKARTDNPNWKKKNQNANDKTEEPIEDITNPLKYVIVSSDYPQTLLTDEHSSEIQTLLTNEMLKIKDEESLPRFWSCYLRHGSLLVFSADEKSKDWLVETVPSLAVGNDIILKTGPAKDILQTTKISLFVPKLFKDLSQDQVIHLVKSQNTGLRADLWQILECKEEEKGRMLNMAIDEESFKIIKNLNYKIHLGLGLVKFSGAQYFNVSVHGSGNH